MHVILNTSDDDRIESLLLSDTSHVSPQPGLEFFGNDSSAPFGAEDQVNPIAGIGTRQCVVPPGLQAAMGSLPALKRWAKLLLPGGRTQCQATAQRLSNGISPFTGPQW